MKKKSRININTNFKIYFEIFLNFVFFQREKKELIFKNNLKKFLFTENILLTAQGRVAALNIFKVIISKEKKEILICPYTLTEVINAIIYAGGKPIYVDIDLAKGLPLESDLNKKINNNTAGLVLTHLYSNEKDIIDFHKKYNQKIQIIEDTAINFGSKVYNDKFLGTIFDYGFYSFGTMKNLCTLHGGAIFAKDKSKLREIEKNLIQNIEYPIIESLKLIFFCLLIDFFFNKYIYNFFTHYVLKLNLHKLDVLMYPGVYPKFFKNLPDHYNYKFQSNFSIAGIENLRIFNIKNKSRVEKVKLYEKYLNSSLLINSFSSYKENSFLEYPVLLKKNNNKFYRKKFLEIGYDIRHTWYVSNVRYLNLKYNFEDFPNCETLHDQVLTLPTHDNILEKDIIKLCKLINFYENK